MSRRGGTITFVCAESACREPKRRAYDLQREIPKIYEQQERKPWRCERHDEQAAQILSPVSLERTGTTTCIVRDGMPDYRWWRNEDDPPGHTPWCVEGPGFKAWAKDFPVGTRIVVTATVVLPEGEAS